MAFAHGESLYLVGEGTYDYANLVDQPGRREMAVENIYDTFVAIDRLLALINHLFITLKPICICIY